MDRSALGGRRAFSFLKKVFFRPEPEETPHALKRNREIAETPQFKELFYDKRRPRVKSPECHLPEFQDLVLRHRVGDKGSALIRIVSEFLGDRAIFIQIVVKVGPRERRDRMEFGDVGI